ncbi:ABC transporter permease [Staphylococcus gallinarum]|uniref:Putative hemin transport system permease protein HrtB n=1 Tax=Staphylococcus gallinarum TaxID=1293 RepID=A0A418HQL2_STAGA|nr:ABC transporter permease [Staphylococcus gallinarum]MCD8826975.1 ABC transporter permease [Staphylococcus gallinarum]PTE75410.1 heme ABC transporter permease [Staphylococcus gallinarum]RIL43962.1 ABC transporter permease [Staphylococcus gallinarum]RIO95919.1 ABC transporter permease [Staphylococcus gallinarum]
MKLAWKEMKYYKFRYILIMFIILLLATMVLFISGLAQGLARENVSLLDNMKAQKFVMEDNKKPQLEQSNIQHHKQQEIEQVTNQQPLQLASQTLKLNDDEETVTMINLLEQDKPQLIKGSYPTKNNEIAINEKLKAQGLTIGDQVQLKSGTKLKVTGEINDTMYAHSSVVVISNQGFNKLNTKTSTVYPLINISKKDQQALEKISGIAINDKADVKNAIPSYQAEQSPLNMMVISLFVISAIVLTAFFYVMTIQKTAEIGILKAIGISTRHLINALLVQIIGTTMVSTIVAIGIILLLSTIMPVTMPFHITLLNLLLVFSVFIVVAVIGALLSLIKLFNVDPIEAIGGRE